MYILSTYFSLPPLEDTCKTLSLDLYTKMVFFVFKYNMIQNIYSFKT